MRHVIVRVIVVVALAAGAGLAFAMSSGPLLSRTGAPAIGGKPAENNCQPCHVSFPLNSGPGMVEILGVPAEYNPGQTYTLRVRVSHPHPVEVLAPRWGFEITAVREDDGTGTGTFILPPPGPDPDYPDSMQLRAPTSGNFISRNYVHQTQFSTRTGNRTDAEWQFQWVAPPTNVERIHFFVAGNAADGTGGTADDYIYTGAVFSDIITVGVPGGAHLERSMLDAPRPNPSGGRVELGYSVARAGKIELAIFDLNGRKVRGLIDGSVEAGAGRVVAGRIIWDGRDSDGSPAPNGVYFARLRVGHRTEALRRILVSR